MTPARRLVPGALAALVLALGLWARDPRQAAPDDGLSQTFYLFGTLVEVVIRDTPEPRARAAMSMLEGDFRRLHRDWHAWRPGELTRLNAALARGQGMAVSDPLLQVLKQGQALSRESRGTFDPAIGGLVALWGFHDDLPPQGPMPDPQQIDRLVAARPRIADLRFDGHVVTSRNPAVQLDLGGYAKGAALDLAVQRLIALGIDNAVLNAGGDLQVIGRHGDRPWRVAIRDPQGWGAVAALSVEPGEGVYTSGNYERFLQGDGVRFSHIIDPRTGWPVRGIVSATVVARDGARADAGATALSVAGPDHWAEIAQAMGLDQVLLIDDSGQMLATPEMAARLELLPPTGGGRRPVLRVLHPAALN
ncbi:FAD:protein FMN transferase [Actibacterium ureilyticum]|uniref:FAD:protein FMN transferase n=1 Tax=Actibacterium ureilyticum TaxID=1590614 RepID=UPI001FE7C09F|nr:FAD:protein FMN transferase [Actibacterium ureilyticum]